MTIKNGDLPVSPVTADKLHGSTCSNGYWDRISMGLTKREYFAALAMQGILSCNSTEFVHLTVQRAVECADELLRKMEDLK